MARARNIKPGLFVNDELAEVEPLGRLLFIGLWTIADREGRLKDRPKKIKAQTLPFDDCDIDNLLQQLENHGFIHRYESGECKLIQILNFTKHQNPHMKEAGSELPAPNLHDADTIQEPNEHTTNPADSLNLITDTLNGEKTGSEEEGSKGGNDTVEVEKVYVALFKKKYGQEPEINYARDRKILKELVNKRGLAETVNLITAYFKTDDDYICDNGHTITLFKSQINKLLAQSNNGKPEYKDLTNAYKE